MVWSHNDNWMVTGDHAGYVKYWQSNMNNVRMFQAHKEPVRGIRYNNITLLFLFNYIYKKKEIFFYFLYKYKNFFNLDQMHINKFWEFLRINIVI